MHKDHLGKPVDIVECQIYSWAQEKSDLCCQLDRMGYAVEFGRGLWKIVNGSLVVAHGTKCGTLYTTAGYINMVVVAECVSGSCLWHKRLGHMSTKGMRMLVAKGELEGLKSVDMGLCESCVMGKQKKSKLHKDS